MHCCSNEERAERPATAATDVNIEQVRALILNNRRVTIDEVANHMHISHGSAYDIMHHRINFHKVCARWIPKQLDDEHKWNHVRICQHLLDRHANEGETFLQRIITGDETWIHHFEPESKRQSMEWKHPAFPAKKKFKSQPSAGKVFWDSQGPILKHYLEKESTVNSERYSDTLLNKLKPAIHNFTIVGRRSFVA